MTFVERRMYAVRCDAPNCLELSPADGDEYIAWETQEQAINYALEANWFHANGTDLCPHHGPPNASLLKQQPSEETAIGRWCTLCNSWGTHISDRCPVYGPRPVVAEVGKWCSICRNWTDHHAINCSSLRMGAGSATEGESSMRCNKCHEWIGSDKVEDFAMHRCREFGDNQ
jgi:hypothetical protein